MLLSKSGFHLTIIFFLLLSFHVGSALLQKVLDVIKKCLPCCSQPKTEDEPDEPQADVNKPSIADTASTLMVFMGIRNQLKMKQIPIASPTPADTDPEDREARIKKFNSIIDQAMRKEKDDNEKTQAEDKSPPSTPSALQDPEKDLFKLPDEMGTVFDKCAQREKITIAEHDNLYNFILPNEITHNAKVDEEKGHALKDKILYQISWVGWLLTSVKPFHPEYKVIDSKSFKSALLEIANECAGKTFEPVKDKCEIAYLYAVCVNTSPRFNEVKGAFLNVREERKRLEAEKAAKAANKNK